MTESSTVVRRGRPAWIMPGLVATALVVEIVAFGGSDPRTALAFSVAYAVAAIILAATARSSRAESRDLLIPGLLFGIVLAWTAASLFWTLGQPAHLAWAWVPRAPVATVDRQVTLFEGLKLAGLACVFLCGRALARSDRAVSRSFSFLLAAGSLYGAWAMFEFIGGSSEYFDLGRRMYPDRLSGSFLSPNTAATLFGVIGLLASTMVIRTWMGLAERGGVVALFRTSALRRLGLSLVALCVTTLALLMTGSRAGIGLTALAQALLWLGASTLTGKRSRMPLVLALSGLLLMVGALVALNATTMRSRNTVTDFGSRVAVSQVHLDAFFDRPVTGYGLGTFNSVNKMAMTPDNFRDLWQLRATHNVYVQWLEEAGAVGALAMFLCLAFILARIALFSLRPPHRVLGLGVLVCSGLILTHGAFDFALQVHGVAAVWAWVLGLGFGLGADRLRGGSSDETNISEASLPAGSEVRSGMARRR